MLHWSEQKGFLLWRSSSVSAPRFGNETSRALSSLVDVSATVTSLASAAFLLNGSHWSWVNHSHWAAYLEYLVPYWWLNLHEQVSVILNLWLGVFRKGLIWCLRQHTKGEPWLCNISPCWGAKPCGDQTLFCAEMKKKGCPSWRGGYRGTKTSEASPQINVVSIHKALH